MGYPVKKGNNINLIIFLSEHTAVLGIDFMFFFNECSMYYHTKFNEALLFFQLRTEVFFIKQICKELY